MGTITSILRLPRQRFWLICVFIFVAAECSDRIALYTMAASSEVRVSLHSLLAFPIGLLNDLAIGLVLGLPFLLALHIGAKFWASRTGAVIAHSILIALLSIPVVDQIADIFFWRDFDSRFNSIAVNYLIFPREVIGTINESFDIRILLAVPLCVGIAYILLRKSFNAALHSALQPQETLRTSYVLAAPIVLAFVCVALGPLSLGSDRTVNEIAANGTERFLNAALTNDQAFDGLYSAMDDKTAIELVRKQVAQDNTTFIDSTNTRSILRHVEGAALPKKLNVVLVLEESFGSVYVDSLDNKGQTPTSPALDRLASDGLFFTNIYATGNRTVNALEAVLTSFPPIPGISTARRPGSEGMYSLPALLHQHGYNTAFLYGGRKVFDNMGTFWRGIGFDAVWDQNDIQNADFKTIWGVADEYLFKEAITRLDQHAATPDNATQPFFLSLLTVSNHRPYLYPAGRIDKDPQEKQRYNSAAYADWAFGDFIAQAREKPWFSNTVFIFIGDHGPRVFGAALVPVQSYRVPLLFYSPGNIGAERNETLGSSIDLAPTLMGLLGLSYDSPFFGSDLRRVPEHAGPEHGGRVLMQHNFSIAYGDGENVAIISPGLHDTGYTMRPGPFELTPVPNPDASARQNVIAITQTAHRLFYAHQYHRQP